MRIGCEKEKVEGRCPSFRGGVLSSRVATCLDPRADLEVVSCGAGENLEDTEGKITNRRDGEPGFIALRTVQAKRDQLEG